MHNSKISDQSTTAGKSCNFSIRGPTVNSKDLTISLSLNWCDMTDLKLIYLIQNTWQETCNIESKMHFGDGSPINCMHTCFSSHFSGEVTLWTLFLMATSSESGGLISGRSAGRHGFMPSSSFVSGAFCKNKRQT